ncbi:MAG: HpaII family restriction endonuclease [Flavobacteriaceae bacterium]|nr:HpaII family restriction endonuclease [Flavobacteriaceae bacterium]
MITGNKGEWSEIYTLFKLLGDKILQPGDENIEKIQNVIYPIVKILRSETTGNFEYSFKDDIVIISGKEEVLRFPISEFKNKAISLLDSIKSSTERTFSIPKIEDFMQSINCISLKASSTTKTDITIIIHDQRTSQQPTLGFSIKSQLGSPSTLLNAGKTTNFIYRIENLNSTEVEEINNIDTRSKIKDRIEKIIEKGGHLKFVGTEKQIFSNNLVLIDSLLPQILSETVFDFYTSNHSKVSDLVTEIENKNPLKFDTSNEHQFYNYKIKRFLTDVALGMMPSKVWSGQYNATGGYLIVKEDGDILCYHIYNRNEFEDYLINNTKLDTASSSRHGFREVYERNGDLYFKLNLQIRFLK